MLPNSFYSSSELGLCFPPLRSKIPTCMLLRPYYKRLLFQSFGLNFCFCFDTLASSFGEKNSEVLVVYLHKQRLLFFFYRGITSEGLCFIIGFYEVFKKKSFKQRLCLACNILCALCLLRKVYASVHLTWSHSNICRIHQKLDFHGYETSQFIIFKLM